MGTFYLLRDDGLAVVGEVVAFFALERSRNSIALLRRVAKFSTGGIAGAVPGIDELHTRPPVPSVIMLILQMIQHSEHGLFFHNVAIGIVLSNPMLIDAKRSLQRKTNEQN